uniref:Photosystem II Psb27 protein n=2 Tax=Pinguiococcus pyrenoidosus TaxID=172671 RepID=A0A7R9U867_9STRA|mmetsp:Transcript_18699/g.70751  ORF Transcript_18699/g.70751 Transcript_18699/m.70751 type:complete len:185 (+) Transcript_18699:262-816(+)
MLRVVALVALLVGSSAFVAPVARPRAAVRMAMAGDSRRDVAIQSVAALGSLLAGAQMAVADEVAAPASTELGPPPTDWGLSNQYYDDAVRVVNHMRYATIMPKSTPNYEAIATNCKKEMIDFVSFYRRFPNVAGKPSFSTLYTAINVLAGHYTNYGVKFPVPEKRKKRLLQEYAEIEKNIKRSR